VGVFRILPITRFFVGFRIFVFAGFCVLLADLVCFRGSLVLFVVFLGKFDVFCGSL